MLLCWALTFRSFHGILAGCLLNIEDFFAGDRGRQKLPQILELLTSEFSYRYLTVTGDGHPWYKLPGILLPSFSNAATLISTRHYSLLTEMEGPFR